jgi:plasmid stabilization system protein ParE
MDEHSRLIWSLEAIADLDGIWDYYEVAGARLRSTLHMIFIQPKAFYQNSGFEDLS